MNKTTAHAYALLLDEDAVAVRDPETDGEWWVMNGESLYKTEKEALVELADRFDFHLVKRR